MTKFRTLRLVSASLVFLGTLLGLISLGFGQEKTRDNVATQVKRPNIVFAIADDWGWPHASAFGEVGIQTPTFDRIAKEGVFFTQAFVSSPSCTPSRGAIVTGQHFFRLKAGGNLHAIWPENQFPEYPDLLAKSGYHVGHYRKAWGPGKSKKQPGGKTYRSVDAFFDARPEGKPFCFWFGSSDPHRGYKLGSGKASGIDPRKVHLFPFFPDTEKVRNDVADYFFEVQRFDRQVGELLKKLKEMGELENTIVIMTSDHGMPFPRCKGNVHDSGTRVPFAVMGPNVVGGRNSADLVSLTDVAPTFLQAAGLDIPTAMTGKSLWPILSSKETGIVDSSRKFVLVGRERHTVAQAKGNQGGYPVRAIRTQDYLYVRNFEPDRWPAGTPDFNNAQRGQAWLADCDNGPTKMELWDLKDDPRYKKLYQICFAKRGAEELYDLKNDPDQVRNVINQETYQKIRKELSEKLTAELKNAKDPRIEGNGSFFDEQPYSGGAPQWPRRKKKQNKKKQTN